MGRRDQPSISAGGACVVRPGLGRRDGARGGVSLKAKGLAAAAAAGAPSGGGGGGEAAVASEAQRGAFVLAVPEPRPWIATAPREKAGRGTGGASNNPGEKERRSPPPMPEPSFRAFRSLHKAEGGGDFPKSGWKSGRAAGMISEAQGGHLGQSWARVTGLVPAGKACSRGVVGVAGIHELHDGFAVVF